MIKKNYNESLIIESLKKSYNSFNISHLHKILKVNPPNIIIDCLNAMNDDKIVAFILVASKNTHCRQLFKGLNFDVQEELLENATDSELKIILHELWNDEILNVMQEHKDYFKRILLLLDHETRSDVKKLANYDEDEVGSIMNPEYIALQETWTISKCLNILKKGTVDVENVNELFVINDKNRLVGKVRLEDLFFASNYKNKLSTITDTSVFTITPTAEIEDVIQMFDKYSIDILAVCDKRKTLLGFIKNQDIVEAMSEEVTEDIYKMYGMSQLKYPYLNAPILSIVKSRILWLFILMISATLTSFVIERFQLLSNELTQGLSTLLIFPLIPVLTGTTGNAGAQCSASVIRSLSIGELTDKEYGRAILREMQVGFLIGFLLAVINIIRLAVYYAIVSNVDITSEIDVVKSWNKLESYNYHMLVAAGSSLALWISIILSKFIGTCLPLLATKFKLDPTVMSAPILATVLDITTTTILFGIGIGLVTLIPGI